jgi:hypothetical protein
MSTPTLLRLRTASNSAMGLPRQCLPTPPPAVTLAALAADVDKLAELRAVRKQLDADERALTARVLDTLSRHDLPAFHADRATVRAESPVCRPCRVRAAEVLRVVLGKAKPLVGDCTAGVWS